MQYCKWHLFKSLQLLKCYTNDSTFVLNFLCSSALFYISQRGMVSLKYFDPSLRQAFQDLFQKLFQFKSLFIAFLSEFSGCSIDK